jgi:hypothetical protein
MMDTESSDGTTMRYKATLMGRNGRMVIPRLLPFLLSVLLSFLSFLLSFLSFLLSFLSFLLSSGLRWTSTAPMALR